jgi:hypothetical protein
MKNLPKKRNRARAEPAANAFRYSLVDAMAMSGFGKTTMYELMKSGALQRAPDIPGLPVGVVGDSLRALLKISSEEVA